MKSHLIMCIVILLSTNCVCDYAELYTEFCHLLYTATSQNPPIAQNVANPEFRDQCIHAKILHDKLQTIIKRKPPFTSDTQKLSLSIANYAYVIIWAYTTSMAKLEDYHVSFDSDDKGFVDWPTKEQLFDFVDKICEAYNYIEKPQREKLQTKLRAMAEVSWEIVNERPPIYEGKYLNGYMANGLHTISVETHKVYKTMKHTSPEFKIIMTNIWLFSQVNQKGMQPWLHGKWQLQIQLISYAGMYLLKNRESKNSNRRRK